MTGAFIFLLTSSTSFIQKKQFPAKLAKNALVRHSVSAHGAKETKQLSLMM